MPPILSAVVVVLFRGKAFGASVEEKEPVRANETVSASSTGNSSFSSSGSNNATIDKPCCKALTVECLACSVGMTEAECEFWSSGGLVGKGL